MTWRAHVRRWWRANVCDEMPHTLDDDWMYWSHWVHCTDDTCPCHQTGQRPSA